jgi:hypothetical protein
VVRQLGCRMQPSENALWFLADGGWDERDLDCGSRREELCKKWRCFSSSGSGHLCGAAPAGPGLASKSRVDERRGTGDGQDAETKTLDATATQWSFQLGCQGMPDYQEDRRSSGQQRAVG